MAAKSKQRSGSSPKQIKSDYRDVVYYYRNEKGQVFLCRVRGTDPGACEQYIKELRPHIEVVPYAPGPSITQDNNLSRTNPNAARKSPRSRSPRDLSVRIQLIEGNDVKPPYTLRFTLGSAISLGSSHDYEFSAPSISVTVTVGAGDVDAELYTSQDNPPMTAPVAAQSLSGDQTTGTLSFQAGLMTPFMLLVSSAGPGATYEISGDISDFVMD